MSTPHKTALPALILLIAAIVLGILSIPALNGPLVLDSNKLYALEGVVTEHGNSAVFHTPGFGVGFERIISMFSFLLNIQGNGSLSPSQLKLTNIAIHITCGFFAFLSIQSLLRQSSYREKATTLALITGLLWLLSPINFNTSIYTIQRMTQLSALFALVGLFLYSKGRLSTHGGLRLTYIGAALAICAPLAALSKENGILLLAFLFLAELYFLNTSRPLFKDWQLVLAGSLGAIAAVFALVYFFPGTVNYDHRDFTLAERLLSQPRALIDYAQGIIFPYGSDIGLFTDDFVKSASLFKPIATIVSLLALTAISIFCVVGRRTPAKLAAYGLAFFLIGHAVESTFISLELYFPHRNYLPSLGVYLAAAWVIVYCLPSRNWSIVMMVIILTYFSAITYARSLTWSSRENIISTSVYYHPNSPRALSSYAQLALEQKDYKIAFAAINKAISHSNTLNRHIQRLYILCEAGATINNNEYERLKSAESLGVSNELAQALTNTLSLYKAGGCTQLNAADLVSALDDISTSYEKNGLGPWTIEYYAVEFLYVSGDKRHAHKRLQTRFDNGHAESGLYRVKLLIEEGNIDEAERTLEQARNQIIRNSQSDLLPILNNFNQQLNKIKEAALP